MKLSEFADMKKPIVMIKPEKKDFKDEEKDYPTFLDPSVKEVYIAPTKSSAVNEVY
jgi:hypothetical protein